MKFNMELLKNTEKWQTVLTFTNFPVMVQYTVGCHELKYVYLYCKQAVEV